MYTIIGPYKYNVFVQLYEGTRARAHVGTHSHAYATKRCELLSVVKRLNRSDALIFLSAENLQPSFE